MPKKITLRHFCSTLLCLTSLSWVSLVSAVSPDDAKGLWMTAEKDAVIQFQTCPDKDTSLCGSIVWDIDAGTPADTCGVQIAQLDSYDDDTWRDGWVYDPREDKNYKATIRVKDEVLKIRAFIGVEILGQNELLSRTYSLPETPVCAH
jgi:uncharacterized protein (DUF2147 family)